MSNQLQDDAADRTRLHQGQASTRPLSPDYDLVGLAGEQAFEDLTGCRRDRTARPAGDSGADFEVRLGMRLDVKTARKPVWLFVEQGKVQADIYVLAQYDDATHSAKLLGWAWAGEVRRAPVRDFGFGISNHYIPRENLKPMQTLLERMKP